MIANFVESFVNATALTLLHFLWQGLLIGCLFFVGMRLFRNRYAVASFSLAALFMAAAVTFAFQWTQPVASLPTTVAQSPAEAVSTKPENGSAATTPVSNLVETTTAEPSAPLQPPAVASRAMQQKADANFPSMLAYLFDYWNWFVACVWMLGVTFFTIRLGNDWRSVRRLRSSSQPLPANSHWAERFEKLVQTIGVGRPVEFLTSQRLTSPIATGVFQPVVILPLAMLCHMPTSQVEAIVLHELAHIRRHDYLVNILQRVMETVFFFHPIVWVISHRMRIERELCCDDIASQKCSKANDYVFALAALEEIRSAENYELAPAAKGVRQGSLLHRISRLIGDNTNDHLGIDWRLPAILLAGCALFFMTLTVFVVAGDNSADIRAKELQTSSYSHSNESVFCIHTNEKLLAVFIIEQPRDLLSESSSSGVNVASSNRGANAWADMKWGDQKLAIRFFKDRPDQILLNGKPYAFQSGRVFYWNAAESKVTTQANLLKESLPAFKATSNPKLNQAIQKIRSRIMKTFPVKAMKEEPAEKEPVEEAGETPLPAAAPADHNVTVFGTVVDDETGKLIEQAVIVQGGMFDPAKPAAPTTFGYSRTGGGRKTGKFSAAVNFPKGRTARVLVDGYYPQPVVTMAPKADVKRMEVTLRLKKLRTISGRVLNHLKEPVVGANIFTVSQFSTTYSGGQAWTSIDSKDTHATPHTTDAEGRFSGVPVGELNSIAVSADVFDAWSVIVAEDETDVIIELPKPAKVVIDYDITGDDDTAKVFYQYLSPFYEKKPQWKNVAIERLISIKKGKTSLASLPAGSYQISRQRLASMGPVGRYVFMEREYFTVKPGETHSIDWRRTKGARVKAKVTWPKDVNVAGLMYQVVGEPKKDLGGLDSRNILDGAGIDIKTGEIHTTILPPGEYTLEIAAQKPVSKERMMISSPILPSYQQKIPLKIPTDLKEVDLKEIELAIK